MSPEFLVMLALLNTNERAGDFLPHGIDPAMSP